jgi:hypothetical protein
LSTAFLAPAMRTSPFSGAPPVITNFCMERCSLVGLVRAPVVYTYIRAPRSDPYPGQASFHSWTPW